MLKSNWPKRCAYANKFGFTVDSYSKFKVRKACGRRQLHSTIGKSGWRVDNPALKWFLNVWIALCSMIMRWNYLVSVLFICTWHFVLVEVFQSDKIFSYLIHACVIVLACLFFIGEPKMALESTWYTIKIYSFPLLDLYGKRPVRSMNVLSLLWMMVYIGSCVLECLVDLRPCLYALICSNSVWILGGRCFLIRCVASPGHDMRKLFCIALMKIYFNDEKQAACRYVAKSYAFLSTLKMMFKECWVGAGWEVL